MENFWGGFDKIAASGTAKKKYVGGMLGKLIDKFTKKEPRKLSKAELSKYPHVPGQAIKVKRID